MRVSGVSAAAVAVVVLFQAVAAFGQTSGPIVNLPGAPAYDFNMYSGYIVVNESHGRNMFYWFVESQNNPATDPLVLWLNGGPGCSSLQGALGENGPFTANADGQTLRANPSSWNQIANVVYLESPSGVGFSYSNTTADYTTGDYQTAQDSVVFLHQFLKQYPQFQTNDFWITGESYGGHYVPNLAAAVLEANGAGQTPNINLKGFQVGNAWTSPPDDNKGAVFQWWSHALISDETYQNIDATCNFAEIGPLLANHADPAALGCNEYLNTAYTDMNVINIYDIYTNVCLDSDNDATTLLKVLSESGAVTAHMPAAKFLSNRKALARKAAVQKRRDTPHHIGDEIPDPDPCFSTHLAEYLNQPAVQEAIHASITYPWVGCSNIVSYSYTDVLTSVVPVYQKLFSSGIRMLVLSGDVDGIVPIPGTRAWLANLNLTVKSKWRAWLDSTNQTGGYVTEYDGLTFASVRDAGHMVPYTQPGRSFDLFSRFLLNKPI